MIHIKTKLSKSAVLLGTAVFFTISPAWAGFEWASPPAPEKVMTAPEAPEAAPAPVVESRAIKDKEEKGEVQAKAQIKAKISKAGKPVNQISKMPPAMMEEPVVASVLPVSGAEIPAQKAPTEYEEVQGFGSDIPLVTAMSQIVPAEFAYSVKDSSLLGEKVSWTGGMAWNKALENAVAPLGLDVVVVDDTVWLREKTPESESMKEPKAGIAAVPDANPVQGMRPSSSMMPRPPATNNNAPLQPVMDEKRSAGAGSRNASVTEESSLGYPRRNPIPMMMKAGETEASDAPQPMATMSSSVPEANPVDATKRPQQNAAGSGDDGDGYYQHVMVSAAGEQSTDGQSTKAGLDPFEIKYWTAKKGDSLRNVLINWGQLSGTKIHWTSPYDYRLPFALETHATFPDAVTKILTLYEDLEPRPVGRLHPNLPDGPSVLVIKNHGTMVN